jgi:HAD superfamily hydrolase (TIGR01458 family)
MIKGVLLDLSGTIYVGDEVLPRALEAVEKLHAENIPLRYLTNSSRIPGKKILAKLLDMGFSVRAEEIFTAPMAVQAYLREHKLSPWLLAHPAIREEFEEFSGANPDAVVLCDAAEDLSYENLNQAFRILLKGARLLAVGDNRYFKEADGMSLDAGPFIRALEYAADCEAIVLGKPSPVFFHSAAAQLGCQPGETLMVGDDVFADVNGALKAGMKAALVQTGKYQPGDELKIAAPGACVCGDLLDAVEGVLSVAVS